MWENEGGGVDGEYFFTCRPLKGVQKIKLKLFNPGLDCLLNPKHLKQSLTLTFVLKLARKYNFNAHF